MKRKYCSKKCSSNAQKSNYIYSQKQVRFQIFLRDNFTCIYCGRTSFTHNIELQLDHVVARNNNGTDSIDNYATSCKDCNLSKKDKKLSQETEQKILSEIKKRNEIFDYNKFSLPITFL
jgi:5-methylcytosine-specific restriction endonuclease McrA